MSGYLSMLPWSRSKKSSAIPNIQPRVAVPSPVEAPKKPDGEMTPCAHCGGTDFDQEGYCEDCGTRKRREQPSSVVLSDKLAAATDIGIRHKRNDDAFAIGSGSSHGCGDVLVVCDGVSNSQDPDIGSAAAARVAKGTAQRLLDIEATPHDAIHGAIVKAHEAICSVKADPDHHLPPSACTIVMAVVSKSGPEGTEVTIGWLGDSRAYHITQGEGSVLLTKDHSWVNEVVDSGQMSKEEAENDRRAHAITRCLGAEDASVIVQPCLEPTIVTVKLKPEGFLLLCTDGLWNYAEEAEDLKAVVKDTMAEASSAALCKTFIDFANESGGIDNITAAIARLKV